MSKEAQFYTSICLALLSVLVFAGDVVYMTLFNVRVASNYDLAVEIAATAMAVTACVFMFRSRDRS